MIQFGCKNCGTLLAVADEQGGLLVRCPQCLTSQPAPGKDRAAGAASVGQGRATPGLPRGPGRRYGFDCPYCSSRLEASEAMAAREGQCPTCGSTITIPILDRYGRLIDPLTRQIIRPDPHPVHAYAAAGERAPRVVRREDGGQLIECPRCGATSQVTANNCARCGVPFTMEGTVADATGATNGYCIASLVLGLIGLPAGCTGIVPLLAIVLGVVGLGQVARAGGGGRGMAYAGIALGLVGVLLFAAITLRVL